MATLDEALAMRERLEGKRASAFERAEAELGLLDQAIAKIDEAVLQAYMGASRMDDVLAVYIKTRDEKNALVERQKMEVEAFNVALAKIEKWIFARLSDSGAESIRAKTGTAFFRNVTSAKIEDRSAFFEWVFEDKDRQDLLEARCSKLAVESYLESTGELPPGVSRRVERLVSVKRP